MNDRTTWYQIRFSFSSTTKARGINAFLLEKYVEGIYAQNKKLEHPFVTDIFCLNMRAGTFDKSLPAFVFVKCEKKDMKLISDILKQANIQHLGITEVSEQFVQQYRDIYENAQSQVWSSVCIGINKYGNAIEHIDKIRSNIEEVATRNGVKVYDVVCRNADAVKAGEYDKQIVVYIQHDASANTQIERILQYPRNVMRNGIKEYSISIADADHNIVERARHQKQNKVAAMPEFKIREKVIVIEGGMKGTQGTVAEILKDYVRLHVNIFDEVMHFDFLPHELAPLPSSRQ